MPVSRVVDESEKQADLTKAAAIKTVKSDRAIKAKAKAKINRKTTSPQERNLGKASSAMAKPITVNTVKEIPTDYIDNKDRLSHDVSGRSASTAHAISKSSAGPTKPGI